MKNYEKKSLIMGILSIILCWFVIGIIFSIIGIVFSVKGIRNGVKNKTKLYVGMSLSIISIVIFILLLIFVPESTDTSQQRANTNISVQENTDTKDDDADYNSDDSSVDSSDNSSADSSESEDVADSSDHNTEKLSQYYETAKSYDRAVTDLWDRYENEGSSASSTMQRISGLSDGIQNTISMIESEDDFYGKEEIISLMTGYQAVCHRYVDYLESGDRNDLDDAANMLNRIDELSEDVQDLF